MRSSLYYPNTVEGSFRGRSGIWKFQDSGFPPLLKRVFFNPRTKQHNPHTSHRTKGDTSTYNLSISTTRLIQQSTRTRGCRRDPLQETAAEMEKKSGTSVTVQQVKENGTDQEVQPTRVRQGNSQGGGQHQQNRSQGTRSGDTIPTTNMGNLPTAADPGKEKVTESVSCMSELGRYQEAEIFHDVSLDTDDPTMDVTELNGELEEIDITIGPRSPKESLIRSQFNDVDTIARTMDGNEIILRGNQSMSHPSTATTLLSDVQLRQAGHVVYSVHNDH
jgi:hypothetical protein